MNQPDHIPHLPKPPRAWLTLLMGGLLLFSGMVVGAGGSLLFFQNRMDQPDNAPKHFSKRLAQRMSHDLNLSEEQSKQVETIFKAHQEEMSTIRLQIKDEVDASFETLKTEVEAVLTPEQAALWEERIHEYRDRDRGGHGGPGDPRGGKGGHKRPGDGEHYNGDGPPPPRPDGEEGYRPPRPPRDRQEGHKRPPRDGRSGEYPPPPPRDGQEGDHQPPPPNQ